MKWFDTEGELKSCNVTQRSKIDKFLSTFLEIGRIMKLKNDLKQWCKKVYIRPHEIPKTDPTRITSWPMFIGYLVETVEKSE